MEWNEGSRAAIGRGRSPPSRLVGNTIYATAVQSRQYFDLGAFDETPSMGASPTLPLSLKSSFRGERFSDHVCVRRADRTTCYPGRRPFKAPAHYGVSVTVKGSENERAQPINRSRWGGTMNLNGSRAVFRKVLWEQKGHEDWGGKV